MTKLLAICFSCLFFASAVYSADETQSEIERLIEQLGSDDWRTREESTSRLIETGEQAGLPLEKVMNSADPEVRLRTGRILKEIGWIPSSLREKTNPLIEKLKSADDNERCAALDELLKIIPPHSLKKVLSLPPGKLEITFIDPPPKTCLPGTKMEFKAKVTNADNTPFWVCKSQSNDYFPSFSFTNKVKRERYEPHIIPTEFSDIIGIGCGMRRGFRRVSPVTLPNPLKDFILLEPGKSITQTFEMIIENATLAKITAITRYQSGKSMAKQSLEKWENDHPANKGYIEVYDLLIPYQDEISTWIESIVIPEEITQDKIKAVNGLLISLEPVKEQFTESEDLVFNLTFHNKGKGPLGLVKHEDSGYPLWVIVKSTLGGNKQEVVQIGALNFNSEIVTDKLEIPENELTRIELAPDKTVSSRITIKNNLKTGNYNLTLGYRINISDINVSRKTYSEESNKIMCSPETKAIWSGEVISNPVSFEVVNPTK